MDYSIRDVSEFLHLSREMIRYYEKWGVLTPKRNEQNNYRSYTILDVFMLLDAIQYKSWGIPVKDMGRLRKGEFLEEVRGHLTRYQQELEQEAAYKVLLSERIRFVADRSRTAHLNLQSYWVKVVPEHYFIPLVQGDGDSYGSLQLGEQAAAVLFSERVAPFWNPCFEEVGDHQLWGFTLEKRYYEALNLPPLEDMRLRPEKTCLCAIIDLGSVGCFNGEYAEPALEHLRRAGFEQAGTIDATLLGRGVEDGKDIRLMELHIPLREKTL